MQMSKDLSSIAFGLGCWPSILTRFRDHHKRLVGAIRDSEWLDSTGDKGIVREIPLANPSCPTLFQDGVSFTSEGSSCFEGRGLTMVATEIYNQQCFGKDL